MKKNNIYLADNEIDLRKIIKILLKEKILILSISLIFTVLGYVYSTFQPKIYKTLITIRDIPPYLLEPYDSLTTKSQLAIRFNDAFKLNLLSIDTLAQFLEEDDKMYDFRNHLKEKNISVREYFKSVAGKLKFEVIIHKKDDISKKYSITYSKPLLGESFSNNYIIFVQQKTIAMLKEEITQNILNDITNHQNHLEIAKKIGIEKPILGPVLTISSFSNNIVTNEKNVLFYQGTTVLSLKIIYLTELLNKTKNLTFNYSPILEQASKELLISKYPEIYIVIALLIGFFLSLVTIYFKQYLKIKVY
jgi:LPS O-antigen subunit length determinant protein (WzzB/FepE family)